LSATGAGDARGLVLPMNHQTADVRNPSEGVSENNHGIVQVKQAVAQQRDRADEAQPPKRLRNYDLFLFFCGIPLHEKA